MHSTGLLDKTTHEKKNISHAFRYLNFLSVFDSLPNALNEVVPFSVLWFFDLEDNFKVMKVLLKVDYLVSSSLKVRKEGTRK